MDVASLHASIPADSRVTQSFPRWTEERDDVHHEPAERANSMKAAAIAGDSRNSYAGFAW